MIKQKTPELGFYGRRVGKTLRPPQAARFKKMMPDVGIQFKDNEKINLKKLFNQDCDGYGLEIGFGGGEHLAWQAQHRPDFGFIGIEPFINGVSSLLHKMEEADIKNIRIYDDNIRPQLPHFPDNSFDVVYILFPDPWPKTRHHKRRIVCDYVLDHAARLLKKDGELRLASDIEDYVQWMLDHVNKRKDFKRDLYNEKMSQQRPADWPPTRYEQKAIKQGRAPTYLLFTRI